VFDIQARTKLHDPPPFTYSLLAIPTDTIVSKLSLHSTSRMWRIGILFRGSIDSLNISLGFHPKVKGSSSRLVIHLAEVIHSTDPD
jgi:hypothetical protein